MPDRLITVATYNLSFEAEAARNLLEAEGIRAFVNGGQAGSLLPIFRIHLQVQEEDAPRASALLAAVEASRDPDWEERAETGAGVWTCSLCGEPVANEMEVCPSCQTPREAIRTSAKDVRKEPPSPPSEGIRTRDQVTATPESPTPPAVVPPLPEEKETEEPSSATAEGDALARRALHAAVFSLFIPFFWPIAWWYLACVVFHDGDLSRLGTRHFNTALVIPVVVVLAVFVMLLVWH
jgi:hypothetical protein